MSTMFLFLCCRQVKKAYPRFVKRRKEARIAQKEYLQQARESAWNLSKKNGALMVKMNKVRQIFTDRIQDRMHYEGNTCIISPDYGVKFT